MAMGKKAQDEILRHLAVLKERNALYPPVEAQIKRLIGTLNTAPWIYEQEGGRALLKFEDPIHGAIFFLLTGGRYVQCTVFGTKANRGEIFFIRERDIPCKVHEFLGMC